MTAQEFHYCENCSKDILAEWKGWPHKNAIPRLPTVTAGKCEECGESGILSSNRITWLNYHSEYSTGLPDHWLLVIDGDRTKWGRPYYAEACCPTCGHRTIVSEMKYPNGKCELKHNCDDCGVKLVK